MTALRTILAAAALVPVALLAIVYLLAKRWSARTAYVQQGQKGVHGG